EDPRQLSGIDPGKLQEQATRNTVTYAPEMGRYMDAQLDIMQAVIACVLSAQAADPQGFDNPKSQGGLAKMRAGVGQTLTGFVSSLAAPGLTDEWRRARLAARTRVAPDAERFMTPQDARALRQLSLAVAQGLRDPTAQAGLRSFATTVAQN